MNEGNSGVKTDGGVGRDKGDQGSAAAGSPDHGKRRRLWVNWALALLTVLGSGLVVVYFFGAVMSTAGCSVRTCQHVGPNWVSPDVLLYGPPVVAALTIVVSFFTARRRWGIAVPLAALALLGADVAILATTVAQ
jgi:hypothetical protein